MLHRLTDVSFKGVIGVSTWNSLSNKEYSFCVWSKHQRSTHVVCCMFTQSQTPMKTGEAVKQIWSCFARFTISKETWTSILLKPIPRRYWATMAKLDDDLWYCASEILRNSINKDPWFARIAKYSYKCPSFWKQGWRCQEVSISKVLREMKNRSCTAVI